MRVSGVGYDGLVERVAQLVTLLVLAGVPSAGAIGRATVAFYELPGLHYGIVVTDEDGGGAVEITRGKPEPAIAGSFSWAPDGPASSRRRRRFAVPACACGRRRCASRWGSRRGGRRRGRRERRQRDRCGRPADPARDVRARYDPPAAPLLQRSAPRRSRSRTTSDSTWRARRRAGPPPSLKASLATPSSGCAGFARASVCVAVRERCHCDGVLTCARGRSGVRARA
jgi:hypothetical protein